MYNKIVDIYIFLRGIKVENLDKFRTWLQNNTNYSERTIGNIVCRLRRANKILPWFNDEVYMLRLKKIDEYANMTVSVRSQVKKAVDYYNEFINEKECEE